MIGKRLFESQDEMVEYNDIIYLIKSDENTACVIGSKENIQKVIIPISINHKSKEYNVTSILKDAFKFSRIKIVEFSKDSKLQTICNNSFYCSKIKRIQIPSSVTSIEEEAFSGYEKLELVEIPDDSKLQMIDKNAFCVSKITSIRIPSELIDLIKEWSIYTPNLAKISVSPKNPRYCFF